MDIQLYSEGYEYSINSSADIPHGIQEVSEETRQKILDVDTVENVTCYKERINSDGVYYQNTALSSVAIRVLTPAISRLRAISSVPAGILYRMTTQISGKL